MKDCQETIGRIYILKVIAFVCLSVIKNMALRHKDYKQALRGQGKVQLDTMTQGESSQWFLSEVYSITSRIHFSLTESGKLRMSII